MVARKARPGSVQYMSFHAELDGNTGHHSAVCPRPSCYHFYQQMRHPRENAQMSPKHIALRACKTGSFASVFAMCKGPDDHSSSRFMLSMFANI